MSGPTPRRTIARAALLVGAAAALTTACAPDPPTAVVGIRVEGCSLVPELGSGMFVDDDLVLTSAHILRGARVVEVVRGDEVLVADIVGFDPEMDLAYLAVGEGAHADAAVPAIASEHVEPGDTGSAWVVRRDGIERVDVVVRRRLRINTEDIYVKGETSRPGFELDAEIQPGDSGGAVIIDGQVVGVLWARSRRFPGRSYAIDPTRAGALTSEQLRTGELGDEIDISRCS